MKKLLCIEGQFSLPLIRNGLINPFMLKHPGVIQVTWVKWYEWLAKFERFPETEFDVVIGHSLGGQSVVDISRFGRMKAYISLDPRHQTNMSFFDVLYPFQANFKTSAPNFYNFYRHGFMPGYRVDGAKENVKLNCSHVGVPWQKEVMECLERLVL